MTPLKIVMFCQRSGGDASGVDQAIHGVRLNAIRPSKPSEPPSVNQEFFDRVDGNAYFEIVGTNELVTGAFKSGRKYVITISEE